MSLDFVLADPIPPGEVVEVHQLVGEALVATRSFPGRRVTLGPGSSARWRLLGRDLGPAGPRFAGLPSLGWLEVEERPTADFLGPADHVLVDERAVLHVPDDGIAWNVDDRSPRGSGPLAPGDRVVVEQGLLRYVVQRVAPEPVADVPLATGLDRGVGGGMALALLVFAVAVIAGGPQSVGLDVPDALRRIAVSGDDPTGVAEALAGLDLSDCSPAPGTSGRMVMRFEVAAGAARDLEQVGGGVDDPTLAGCVASAIGRVPFPKREAVAVVRLPVLVHEGAFLR